MTLSTRYSVRLTVSMMTSTHQDAPGTPEARLRTLREIEQRVLWLSTAIVDQANRVRPNPSGLKVGGHQASSASMVTIMTALWFEQLQAGDRVSVKPHASPGRHPRTKSRAGGGGGAARHR